MKENTKLVILAGGASSRMKKQLDGVASLSEEEKKQANTRSKGLISFDNSGRPFLDYLLYNAKKAGYKEVFIITGTENSLFKSFYGDKNEGNVFNELIINYAIQHIPKDREKPFGTADALYQAMQQYSILKMSSFTVCNSDNLYSINALELLRNNADKNSLISYDRDALKFLSERIARFALLSFSNSTELISIIEKPKLAKMSFYKDEFGKYRVSMNIFKFDGNMIFKYLENCPINQMRNEKELPTALLNMIVEHPNSTIGIPLSEHVPDLTSKDDIQVLKEYVKNIDISNFK
ncbi:MAG: nucleotidyltransferase [Lutibacter sp.]|nr:MAG: nucleotidyltransferase [Lutibacter sp.]